MPVALLLHLLEEPLAGRHGGAVSGGNGLYDPRSWVVTFAILVMVVGLGRLLRRPAGRRHRGPIAASDRNRHTERPPTGHGVRLRPVAPDDDEEFLRRPRP